MVNLFDKEGKQCLEEIPSTLSLGSWFDALMRPSNGSVAYFS